MSMHRQAPLQRWLRHFLHWPVRARRRFTPEILREITAAVRVAEAGHLGEIRFVAEASLPWSYLRRNAAPRERALTLFGKFRVWDTEHNTGVLIYVNLADRGVEIIADRGVAHQVGKTRWAEICKQMQGAFEQGDWRGGALAGIAAVGAALVEVVPTNGPRENQVSDRPVIL